LTETTAVRRKRLLLRSRYRGFLENDLLLGGFADRHLDRLDEGQLDRYEALLAEPDHDIFAWAADMRPVPARHDNDVMALLRAHCAHPPVSR
jgi:antitoxin CptB